jgi:hypothetical protein
MPPKYLAVAISGGAVAAMTTVATDQVVHGGPADQTKVLTLTPGSTQTIQDGFFYNTTMDEEYRAPPDTTALPRDGLTFPRRK